MVNQPLCGYCNIKLKMNRCYDVDFFCGRCQNCKRNYRIYELTCQTCNSDYFVYLNSDKHTFSYCTNPKCEKYKCLRSDKDIYIIYDNHVMFSGIITFIDNEKLTIKIKDIPCEFKNLDKEVAINFFKDIISNSDLCHNVVFELISDLE